MLELVDNTDLKSVALLERVGSNPSIPTIKVMNKLYLTDHSGENKLETTLSHIQKYVGKGWHPLIEDLVKDLFALGWNGEILQVKEKFGELCFYTRPMKYGDPTEIDNLVFDRVIKAEKESNSICELCSNPASLHISNERSYIRTLCEYCAEQNNFRKYVIPKFRVP